LNRLKYFLVRNCTAFDSFATRIFIVTRNAKVAMRFRALRRKLRYAAPHFWTRRI
jgi:hypothetical protein